jgi:hypothetical protein
MGSLWGNVLIGKRQKETFRVTREIPALRPG